MAVKLAVRPDYVRIAGQQDAAASLTCPVSVELVEILGADALLTTRCGEETLTALVPAERLPQTGAPLTLAFDQHDLHVRCSKRREPVAAAGALPAPGMTTARMARRPSMSPDLELVHTRQDESFRAWVHDYPHTVAKWHFHPEYEVHVITASSGKFFVGDCIDDFGPATWC
jgi:hypothetical protein